jgi:hypothetical protein
VLGVELSRFATAMRFRFDAACFSVLFEQFDDEASGNAKAFGQLALGNRFLLVYLDNLLAQI